MTARSPDGPQAASADVELKREVAGFWEAESCGESSAVGATQRDQLETQSAVRYRAEPYIHPFARFHEGAGRSVLEIGVGMGADHLEWAKARPARLTGVDLTERAVQFTAERLRMYGFVPDVRQGDAEALDLPDDAFDIVYSWGVLHHSPNPQAAVDEVRRVLRPGGRARIMLYHRPGLLWKMLWVRHALIAGAPGRSLDDVISREVESPGTKAYTARTAAALFRGFSSFTCRPVLTMGDLLEGPIGRRHGGSALALAKRLWPRALVRRLGPGLGSDLLIEATK